MLESSIQVSCKRIIMILCFLMCSIICSLLALSFKTLTLRVARVNSFAYPHLGEYCLLCGGFLTGGFPTQLWNHFCAPSSFFFPPTFKALFKCLAQAICHSLFGTSLAASLYMFRLILVVCFRLSDLLFVAASDRKPLLLFWSRCVYHVYVRDVPCPCRPFCLQCVGSVSAALLGADLPPCLSKAPTCQQ